MMMMMMMLYAMRQRSPAVSGSSTGRRPPVAPRSTLSTSRAASLPPVSVDGVHRRRASISSFSRYTSPGPPPPLPPPPLSSLATIQQGGELGSGVVISAAAGHRRASYSSATTTPNYRTRSRHATPDRSFLRFELRVFSEAFAASW